MKKIIVLYLLSLPGICFAQNSNPPTATTPSDEEEIGWTLEIEAQCTRTPLVSAILTLKDEKKVGVQCYSRAKMLQHNKAIMFFPPKNVTHRGPLYYQCKTGVIQIDHANYTIADDGEQKTTPRKDWKLPWTITCIPETPRPKYPSASDE